MAQFINTMTIMTLNTFLFPIFSPTIEIKLEITALRLSVKLQFSESDKTHKSRFQ